MIIDRDTFSFLTTSCRTSTCNIAISVLVGCRSSCCSGASNTAASAGPDSAGGSAPAWAGIVAVSFAQPRRIGRFPQRQLRLKIRRSAWAELSSLMTHGYMEIGRGRDRPAEDCCRRPPARPRQAAHISWCTTNRASTFRVAPGVKVPDGMAPIPLLRRARRGASGESVGGPSWYTEYNVLAGPRRARSGIAYHVTQIAAGRVEAVATALRRCGYRTFSIYPAAPAPS